MPLNNEILNRVIDRWDDFHNEQLQTEGFASSPEEHQKRKESEDFHLRTFKKIEFMEDHFFSEFDLNDNSFKPTFYKWLEQFEFNEEVVSDESFFNQEIRSAFLLASKILFFNRVQIKSLINVVWQKIRKEYFRCLVSSGELSIYDVYSTRVEFLKFIRSSIIVPLSDSAKFEEFRHALPLGPQGINLLESLDQLTDPIDDKAQEYIEILNKKHEGIDTLIIVEDFSGSGTTIIRKIKKLFENYNFEKIYFCPLIITQNSFDNIIRVSEELGLDVNVFYGLMIEEGFSITDPGEIYWSEGETNSLIEISKKYFNLHFNINRFLYDDFFKTDPERPTPYGFRDGGYSIVLFTNCPNNSLPIIWSQNKSWNPLFKRKERHQEALTDEQAKTI